MWLKEKLSGVIPGMPWKSLRRYVKDSLGNRRLSIHQFLDALSTLGIRVQSLAKLEVRPDDVIKVLTEKGPRRKAKKEFGPCLAPWCPSYEKTHSMVEIGPLRDWPLAAICTDCFMQYRYRQGEVQWFEANGDIDFYWNKVYPLLVEGKSFNAASHMLKVDKRL
jgi:hypothetical protein